MKKILNILILFAFLGIFATSAQAQDFRMELQNSDVHNAVLYPNPIIDYKFSVKSEQVISNVVVMNAIGSPIAKISNNSYSTDDLAVELPTCDKGMYLVKVVFFDDKYIIKKLLVK